MRNRETTTSFVLFDSKNIPTEEKLQKISERLDTAIMNRIVSLKDEAAILQSDMEAAQFRMSLDGASADLKDIRVGDWYRISTEVRILQRVKKMVDSLIDNGEAEHIDNEN